MSEKHSEDKKINRIKLIFYRVMYYTLNSETDEDQYRKFFTKQTTIMLMVFLILPFWFIFRPFAIRYIDPMFDTYSIGRPIRRLVLILLSGGPVTIVSWLIAKYVIINDKFIDSVVNCDKVAKMDKKSTIRLYQHLGSVIYLAIMFSLFYFWALPLMRILFS